ncbi:hypothetical protein Tco_0142593, partial [Tanacetum coccineum]
IGQEKKEGASNKENDQNVQDFRAELDNLLVQQKEGYANSTNRLNIVSPSVSAAGQSFNNDDLSIDPLMLDWRILLVSLMVQKMMKMWVQRPTLTTWKQP